MRYGVKYTIILGCFEFLCITVYVIQIERYWSCKRNVIYLRISIDIKLLQIWLSYHLLVRWTHGPGSAALDPGPVPHPEYSWPETAKNASIWRMSPS